MFYFCDLILILSFQEKSKESILVYKVLYFSSVSVCVVKCGKGCVAFILNIY